VQEDVGILDLKSLEIVPGSGHLWSPVLGKEIVVPLDEG
jgi:hypothetical protein